MTYPLARKKEKTLSIHGYTRHDPYYWLNDRENAEVIDYLKAESLVVMTVADDGVGIQGDAPKDGGLGMRMMAYRARLIQAELQIGHNHPSGTLVRCTIHCARCHVGCKKNQTGRGYEQQVGVQSVADR